MSKLQDLFDRLAESRSDRAEESFWEQFFLFLDRQQQRAERGHAALQLQIPAVLERLGKIMANQADAVAAISRIEEATTRQGLALQSLADSLQETSNDIDKILSELGTSVPAEVLGAPNPCRRFPHKRLVPSPSNSTGLNLEEG